MDEEELLAVFQRLGIEDVSPSTIANVIRLADDDGNGTIEWPEFLKIFKVLNKMSGGYAEPKAEGEMVSSA